MLSDGTTISKLAGAELLDREQRLVLPGDQHVADAALDEGRGGEPRAPVSSTGAFL